MVTTAELISPYPDTDPRVVIADGYGVSVSVIRGHLVIKDGVGRHRRERRYSRIDARSRNGIARLIILAETGFVSLEAFDWCERLDVAVAQFRHDGTPLMTSPAYTGDARIRRTQVLCSPGMPLETTGTEILRNLLDAKLQGQHERLEQWGDERSILESKRWLAGFREAGNAKQMISAEGWVASTYWRQWKERVFVPFTPDDMPKVPSHWWRFTGRAGITSEANGYKPGNRNATDPINAMLNYAYAVCLTEANHACHAAGLDPSFGFGHGTDKDKSGMALDLTEPLRPVADSVVLSMLDHGHGIPFGPDGKPAYFTAGSFREDGNGQCLIVPPLTWRIASEVSLAVAPVAAMHAENIVTAIMHTAKITNPARTGAPGSSDTRLTPRKANVTLDQNIGPSDIVPDSLWDTVKHLIPAEPVSRTYKPNPRSDARAALAGVIAHEIYGCSWSQIPAGLGVDRKTCRRRLEEWTALGAWEIIRAEVTKPGIASRKFPQP